MTTRLICGLTAVILALQTLACGSTSVTQMTGPEPARCQATLNTIPTLPAAGGRLDVGVVTQRECAWTAASNSSWVQLSPTSGQGEASITLTTSANPQGTTRSGAITVNGAQYSVTQAASPCTFTVAPTDLSVVAAGGSPTVHVATLTGCSWTASSSTSWISVSPTSTTGSGDTRLTIATNTGPARSGTLTIAGRTVTVGQAAPIVTPPPAGPTPPPPTVDPPPSGPDPGTMCTYELDPASRNIKSKGGDATVKVKTGALCPWMAVSNVDWVGIQEGVMGLGPGDIKYQVDRNRTGSSRTGTITVAGQTHLITQDAGD